MRKIPFNQPSNDAIDVLLVEDNPGDVRLIQEAFKTTDQEITLHTVSSGDDAIEVLTQQPTEVALPDIILSNLHLPDQDGCEVLKSIRSNPRLKPIPVIILTSSEADEDIARCYDARANAYLTKPTAPAEFISLMGSLEQFWFAQAQLPPISG